MAQVVENLPCKHKALSLNPSITRNSILSILSDLGSKKITTTTTTVCWLLPVIPIQEAEIWRIEV
jgi:hypothetical protein